MKIDLVKAASALILTAFISVAAYVIWRDRPTGTTPGGTAPTPTAQVRTTKRVSEKTTKKPDGTVVVETTHVDEVQATPKPLPRWSLGARVPVEDAPEDALRSAELSVGYRVLEKQPVWVELGVAPLRKEVTVGVRVEF